MFGGLIIKLFLSKPFSFFSSFLFLTFCVGVGDLAVDDNGRRPMTAEFAVVLDQDYISHLRRVYRFNSTTDVINFVAVKFNGVRTASLSCVLVGCRVTWSHFLMPV